MNLIRSAGKRPKSLQKLCATLLISTILSSQEAVAVGMDFYSVGKAPYDAALWFQAKGMDKSEVLATSMISEFGKTLVDHLNKFIFNGYLIPRFNRYIGKAVTPYHYEMAQAIYRYPYSLKSLILDKKSKIEILAFVDALRRGDRENTELPRMLLYGAPGVGKTEIAKRVVNEGNFEMRILTGGELARMTAEQMKHLMNFLSKKHKRKIILFIDEAETIFKAGFGNRSPQLQNFIAATGSPSPHFTVIAATNFAEQFDDAAFRRFEIKVRIDLPSLELATKITKSYLDTYLKYAQNLAADLSFFEEETFLSAFQKSSTGLSPAELKQVAQIAVADAKYASGELNAKSIIYYLSDLQSKKNELEAQREADKKKALADLRAQYFATQTQKAMNDLEGPAPGAAEE